MIIRRLTALIPLVILVVPSCGFFTSEEEKTWTGDGCVDYTVESWWPLGVDEVVHLPGAIIAIPHSAGGVDADGFGLDIPAEVVWGGVVYGELPTQATQIGLPMEPGEYTVRRQSQACAEQGQDFTLTVAHPAPIAPTTVTDQLAGDDYQGFGVGWETRRDVYVAIRNDGSVTARVHVDAATDEVLEAFTCSACGYHLRFSDDGNWFAIGSQLFEWRSGAWFYVTNFEGAVEFDPNDAGTIWLTSEDIGTQSVDLATGRRTQVLPVGGLYQIASDGLLVANHELYDPATAELTAASLLADMEFHYWNAALNVAVGTTSQENPGSLWIVQGEPAKNLGSSDCRITYRNRELAFDPLGEFVVAHGVISISTSSYNPMFQVCAISEDWLDISAAADMSYDFEGLSVSRRTISAAWSPDGGYLLTSGLRGVHRHTRAEVESLFVGQ